MSYAIHFGVISQNMLKMSIHDMNLNITSQNSTDSRLVLQLSLPNQLKPGVKSRMKMYLEQRRQAMLQLHLSDQHMYCLLRCVLY